MIKCSVTGKDCRLIIPLLVVGFLSVVPIKDTVWWNTPGGKVIGNKNDAESSCSLMLYDNATNVVIEWVYPNQIFVIVTNSDLKIPVNERISVGMQINSGSWSFFRALGVGGNGFTFATDQPVAETLRSATTIEFLTSDADLSIKVSPGKINTMLSRARECRELMQRSHGK